MKLIDAIRAKRLRQVPPRGRFADVVGAYDAEPISDLSFRPEWQGRFGVELGCSLQGPAVAREDLARQAERLITREVYGEVEDDVMELLHLLLKEGHRPSGDPAMQLIERLLAKLRGGQ